MNNISIDIENKQKLIHFVQAYIDDPLDIILHKKKSKIHSLLKNTELLPNVLINIVHEYVDDVIHVRVLFQYSPLRLSYMMTVKEDHKLLFDGYLKIYSHPTRWYLSNNLDWSLYFDNMMHYIYISECLHIFNQFMAHHYNEPKYIDDGKWRDADYNEYYFSGDYLMTTNGIKLGKLKNKKVFKKIIVILKIVIDIIMQVIQKIEIINHLQS